MARVAALAALLAAWASGARAQEDAQCARRLQKLSAHINSVCCTSGVSCDGGTPNICTSPRRGKKARRKDTMAMTEAEIEGVVREVTDDDGPLRRVRLGLHAAARGEPSPPPSPA